MTIAEKLANLKAKLKEAKTDEEREALLSAIDDVIADSMKVTDALSKANKEAKESREKLKKLQEESQDDEEEEEEEDTSSKKKKKKKVQNDEDEMPSWAKAIVDDLSAIKNKDKASAKQSKIEKALKDAGIPVALIDSIKVADDADDEAIKESVTNFKQIMVDNKLLNSAGAVVSGGQPLKDESIVEYAKEKNNNSTAKGAITGKKL